MQSPLTIFPCFGNAALIVFSSIDLSDMFQKCAWPLLLELFLTCVCCSYHKAPLCHLDSKIIALFHLSICVTSFLPLQILCCATRRAMQHQQPQMPCFRLEWFAAFAVPTIHPVAGVVAAAVVTCRFVAVCTTVVVAVSECVDLDWVGAGWRV